LSSRSCPKRLCRGSQQFRSWEACNLIVRACKEVSMRPLLNIKQQGEHYFELHPWQGTFALTFASLTLVALISVAIIMAFGG
jgi:hypothetical protein